MNANHVQVPRLGCEPDAIKLFIGNIPKSYTEQQLLPLFESFGEVVELVVVKDKSTQLSKGSAFVWYKTAAMAEEAIRCLHKRQKLNDPCGKPRVIAVKEADAPKGVIRQSVRRLSGMIQEACTWGSNRPMFSSSVSLNNSLDNNTLTIDSAESKIHNIFLYEIQRQIDALQLHATFLPPNEGSCDASGFVNSELHVSSGNRMKQDEYLSSQWNGNQEDAYSSSCKSFGNGNGGLGGVWVCPSPSQATNGVIDRSCSWLAPPPPPAEDAQGNSPHMLSSVIDGSQVQLVLEHMRNIQILSGCEMCVKPHNLPDFFLVEAAGGVEEVEAADKMMKMLGISCI